MDSDIQNLVLKLRNLQVLLEEATLRGSHAKIRQLLDEIRATADEIEKRRSGQVPS